MHEAIQIIAVEMDGTDGLIVTFSDGTIAGYVVEELLELRPRREPCKSPKGQDLPQITPTDH
jgi:hypothetical protein